MKKLLIALSFAMAATAAQADIVQGNLKFVGSNTQVAITPSDAGWGPIPGIAEGGYTSGLVGKLQSTAAGIFQATYLGQQAAFYNFYVGGTRMNGLTNGGTIGTTAKMAVAANSLINFKFGEDPCGFGTCKFGSTFANGTANNKNQGMMFFLNKYKLKDKNGRLFDFLIGYNDRAVVNADYDDYVVGVVNHVPVPAALPLMASAMGAFGLSRRKSKVAA